MSSVRKKGRTHQAGHRRVASQLELPDGTALRLKRREVQPARKEHNRVIGPPGPTEAAPRCRREIAGWATDDVDPFQSPRREEPDRSTIGGPEGEGGPGRRRKCPLRSGRQVTQQQLC